MQLVPASSSEQQRQNSSGGGAPTEVDEKEFLAMEQADIISSSRGSPWAATLHMLKKSGLDEWQLQATKSQNCH